MNHKARRIKSLKRREVNRAAVSVEPQEKKVYGAEARIELARRTDPGHEQYSVYGPKVPIVIGFRPNDERDNS